MNILDRKGQNTAEYAILIALVIGAAVAMQTYVKRGMQGRVHDASDKFYDRITNATAWSNITSTTAGVIASKQYEPLGLSSKSTQQTLEDYEKTDMPAGAEAGKVTRESIQRTNQSAGDYQKYDY